MKSYYMTAKNNSTIGYWEKCNATTLAGAKREATKECGEGYVADVICVGVALDDEATAFETVSEKRGNKWTDLR